MLELFGGIGAPRKALENIGIDVKSVGYVEIDEKAVRSYNAIFKENYKTCDINNYNVTNKKVDILFHGSPCQDFSIAGNKLGGEQGSGTRSSLMFRTLEIIEKMEPRPSVVIWENVKNVLSKKMKSAFEAYLSKMEELGYKNTYKVLNSLDFGVAQSRERIYVVSTLGTKFNFSGLENKEALKVQDFLEKTELEKYIVSQPSMLKKIEKTDISRAVPIIKDYCYTITTKQMRCPNAGVIELSDGRYRYLTERECWRLMGFDDADFEAAAKEQNLNNRYLNSALYKQAGNSIVVNVLEAIFKELVLHDENFC